MPPNLLWDLLADIRQKTGNRARPMTHRLALLLLRQWVQQEPYLINRRRHKDQSLLHGTLLERQDPFNGVLIPGVTTQPPDGFRGIGNDPATKDGAAGAMKVPVGQRLQW